jgi:hypothetical protein
MSGELTNEEQQLIWQILTRIGYTKFTSSVKSLVEDRVKQVNVIYNEMNPSKESKNDDMIVGQSIEKKEKRLMRIRKAPVNQEKSDENIVEYSVKPLEISVKNATPDNNENNMQKMQEKTSEDDLNSKEVILNEKSSEKRNKIISKIAIRKYYNNRKG